MRTRMRRLMLIVAALVAAVPLTLATQSAPVMADGPCLNGHNWDNIHQVCV
jgi:hypothetical protein